MAKLSKKKTCSMEKIWKPEKDRIIQLSAELETRQLGNHTSLSKILLRKQEGTLGFYTKTGMGDLEPDGRTAQTDQEKAEVLNKFFVSYT